MGHSEQNLDFKNTTEVWAYVFTLVIDLERSLVRAGHFESDAQSLIRHVLCGIYAIYSSDTIGRDMGVPEHERKQMSIELRHKLTSFVTDFVIERCKSCAKKSDSGREFSGGEHDSDDSKRSGEGSGEEPSDVQ